MDILLNLVLQTPIVDEGYQDLSSRSRGSECFISTSFSEQWQRSCKERVNKMGTVTTDLYTDVTPEMFSVYIAMIKRSSMVQNTGTGSGSMKVSTRSRAVELDARICSSIFAQLGSPKHILWLISPLFLRANKLEVTLS
jgi:hypothetical protein